MNCPECGSPLSASEHQSHLVCTNCERQWFLSKPLGPLQSHEGRTPERLAKLEEAMVALDRRLSEKMADIKEDTSGTVEHLNKLNGTVADLVNWRAEVRGAIRVLTVLVTSTMMLAIAEFLLKKW